MIETDDGPAAALYSAVRGTWKLDAHFDGAGALDRRALFDLASDPGERRDVSASEPAIVRHLSAALAAAEAPREAPPPAQVVLSPEERERLRALGYAE